MIITTLRLGFILAVFALLSACATVAPQYPGQAPTKDSAPSYDVDESKIPDAVPKPEPRSKYGNPANYKVYGRNYYVLASAAGYDKKGTASWYGTKFHHQRTSSGEPYDMFGMTAASRDLPLPTYARVTNLRNGKEIIVKVNDRGPFDKNRIMDLSYVAAKKLDMMRTGTAYVEVKAIDAATYHRRENSDNSTNLAANFTDSHGNIYLQVGAYPEEENAKHVKELASNAIKKPVLLRSVYANGRHTYKVQVGPLNSADESSQVRQRLSDAGLGSGLSITG